MADNEQVMLMLGQIQGQLKGIDDRFDSVESQLSTQGKLTASIDKRVRYVERTSAVHGAVSGTVAGVGVSIVIAYVKEFFKTQGT